MFVTCRYIVKSSYQALQLVALAAQIPSTVEDEAQKSYEKEF